MIAIVAAGLALIAGAYFLADPAVGIPMLATGTMLWFLALFLTLSGRLHRGRRAIRRARRLAMEELSPCLVTDEDGMVVFLNEPAASRYEIDDQTTPARLLRDHFANPAAAIFRLQRKAFTLGAAREDVVARRGHLRLTVTCVDAGAFVWRVDEFTENRGFGRGGDGISLPMLVASKTGTILFMNDALRRVLGGRVKTLDRVFNMLPVETAMTNEVIGQNGPLPCQVYEVEGVGGRREIYIMPRGASESDVRPAFDDLPVPVLEISPGGQISNANRLARDLLADPIAKDTRLSDLVEGLGRPLRDWLEDAFRGRGLHGSEVIRARRTEHEVYLQITLSRVMGDGDPRLMAVLNDATELKTLEAQFVQSQKMQAVGQLAGGVAHDFNNLLTAISGHCDLLLLHRDPGDPEYGDLVQINENANRAASLVGQLLAFSRKQTLQTEVVDLSDTLSDLTHLLGRLVGEKISLSLSHDPELSPIRADRRQLEQVLMNLVLNARDAMPDGGVIQIEMRDQELDTPVQRDQAEVPPGKYVTVQVRDTGSGIAADKLSKIFEPFFTTKRTGEGTGLGLSMAYGIVKQSGGFIFADSTPGQGTTFTLYFPSFERETSATDAAQPKTSSEVVMDKAEGVVLLVEDEAPVRAFASRALRMRGYTVVEADCAEAALEALEDGALNVDLFVTDVVMPGMDGPSWVRRAMRDRPDVKVVFVSGYAEDVFGDEGNTVPNSVFLPKPFSLQELTATVQQQLH